MRRNTRIRIRAFLTVAALAAMFSSPAAAQPENTALSEAEFKKLFGCDKCLVDQIKDAKTDDPGFNDFEDLEPHQLFRALVLQEARALLTAEIEDSRMDKQVGGDAASAGSTSIVSKGSVPGVLGLAVENGALLRQDSGTTITFRGSPVGFARWLGPGYFNGYYKDDDDPLLRNLRKFAFSLSFDTSRGDMPGTFTGDRQQLSGYSFRYELLNKRDPRHASYRVQWADVMRTANGFAKAINDAFEEMEKRPDYHRWLRGVRAAVGAASVDDVEGVVKSRIEALMLLSRSGPPEVPTTPLDWGVVAGSADPDLVRLLNEHSERMETHSTASFALRLNDAPCDVQGDCETPAENAGMKPGDLLVEVDGRRKNLADLTAALNGLQEGVHHLVVWRRIEDPSLLVASEAVSILMKDGSDGPGRVAGRSDGSLTLLLDGDTSVMLEDNEIAMALVRRELTLDLGSWEKVFERARGVVREYRHFFLGGKTIREAAQNGSIVTFEFSQIRNVETPNLSNFKLIAETPFKFFGQPAEFTSNASLTFFNSIPAGMDMGRVRDFQFAAQLDVPLGKVAAGDVLFSVSGLYERLTDNVMMEAMMPGMMAPGDMPPPEMMTPEMPMPALPGDVALAQFKLTIPLTKTGIKIPLSVTYANRTESIMEKEVRGNFGITFDLDSILSGLGGQ